MYYTIGAFVPSLHIEGVFDIASYFTQSIIKGLFLFYRLHGISLNTYSSK